MLVKPAAMSSTSSSLGTLSLGAAGLEDTGRGEGEGRTQGRRRRQEEQEGGSKRGRNKSRKYVEAVVHGGSERRVLNFGRERPWRGRGLWWKEADDLNNLSMRTSTGNTVILGDGFVQRGGNVEQPCAAKL